MSKTTAIVVIVVITSLLNLIAVVINRKTCDGMPSSFSVDFVDKYNLQSASKRVHELRLLNHSASKRVHELPLLNHSFIPLNRSEMPVFNLFDGEYVGPTETDGFAKLTQEVLHFAVIGYAKAGTSTLMKLLGSSDELFVPQWEVCEQPKELNQLLYEIPGFKESESRNQKRGLKCPNLIENIGRLSPLYPHTNFIIGLRHPIKWFESFHNFRANNSQGKYVEAEKQIGGGGGIHVVTTDRAQFHNKLAALGKTPMLEEEKELFSQKMIPYIKPLSQSKIFLYDVDQLRTNDTSTFRNELENFLELKKPLSEPPHSIPGKHRTGKLLEDVTKIKIDICEERYDELRKVLLDNGTRAQKWIRTYFLESEDVTVPDRPNFERILEKWTVDPCSVGDYEGRRSAIAKHKTMKELGLK